MKTTLEIEDELLKRAKSHARKEGKSLGALVEEGLRLALGGAQAAPRFVLPDRSVGAPDEQSPLGALSWQKLREEIYGGR